MLGCAIYELCSLEKAFQGESLSEIIQKIMKEKQKGIPNIYSPFLQKLVEEMLNKTPENRPSIAQIVQLSEIQKEVN